METPKLFLKPRLVALFLIALAISSVSHAGVILLSGDTNITNALSGNFTSVSAGNQQFFTNVLAGGSTVLVLGSIGGSPSVAVADDEVNDFYNSLAGVSSSIHSGAVTAASLAGVDLVFSPLPDDPFTASEIDALGVFLAGGGTVFLTGENDAPVFAAANNAINAALAALGSGLAIVPDSFDGGYQTTLPDQVLVDPFTTGVNRFVYAAPSRVSGGTTLFIGLEEQPFVAYEATEGPTPTPEPGCLFLVGIGLVAAYRRRRA